jgi:nucleoside-diphosphate-sugar epimerase
VSEASGPPAVGEGGHVLVAGCGDLGTEVALRLVAAGRRVSGLRRQAHLLPAVVTPIAADMGAPLPPLPGDVEAVVFAQAAGDRSEDAYRRAYVDGVTHVLDALEAGGAGERVGRVVFVSSTAVYGVDDGSVVDEATPREPGTATGRVLVDAEDALWQRRADATVLRLAGVYGPGRTFLVDQVREGRAVAPDLPVHTNRIHRDDAATAIVHLLTRDAAPATSYLGVDDLPVDRGEVLRFLATELGVAAPSTGPDERSRGGDKRCSNARLRATGWTPRYPTYREGYRAMLAGEGARHP